MPRTTAWTRSVIVLANVLNGSSRLRLAQLNQAFKSVRAKCASLLAAARAYTSRSAIFSRHARALFKLDCCNQCIAFVCPWLHPLGFLRIPFETLGRGLLEITKPVRGWVDEAGFDTGLLTLFARHTSASLLIQENADPDVRGDLERFFARLVPDGDALFRHRDEGRDDMPAHIRAALTAVQLSVPIAGGRLALGTWQGIYVWEHRLRPHRREVVLPLSGE